MSIERADYSLPCEKSSAEKDSRPHVYEGEAIVYSNDGSENVIPREEETHRALSSRQLSMIALGGAIGTGLVIGTGTGLARSGPASLFMSYVVMGTVCCGVMVRFERLESYLPTSVLIRC
ncbi:hypothetical protein C358_00562 [Cryptococcus neoformans MW-RSA852]|nr:hypothetical protein C358_00562 [Cryptococcus neoformans var. grubii MW-RSA852]